MALNEYIQDSRPTQFFKEQPMKGDEFFEATNES